MCMYYTEGINQNGYIMCLHCNMGKCEHPIFLYIYDMTSQCDDIVLLIQEYIKIDSYCLRPDIKNYLHIITPVWHEQKIKQVMGRAVRIHNTLPKDEERTVKTIIYKSNSQTNDE